MSEQQQSPQELELAKKAAVEKKRQAWGDLGEATHNLELLLQATVEAKKTSVVKITKVEELPAAEESLKTAKKDLEAIINQRKAITSKLDKVSARLMQPEKDFEKSIMSFTDSIIKVKKIAKEAADAAKIKQAELNGIAEKVRIYIADAHAVYMNEAAELIKTSYVYALENIPPDQIEAYLVKVKNRVTAAKRTMPAPVFSPVKATKEEVDAEIAKHFLPNPAQSYVDGFAHDLQLKYSDYTIAWENKEQALVVNENEFEENKVAISTEKTQATVAASVQSMASSGVSVEYTTKSLKEVYKLKMEETFENANIIIQAYLSNAGKCREKIRVGKWLTGFGVKQMADALEKLKNDDKNFDFTGLVWGTEDKL